MKKQDKKKRFIFPLILVFGSVLSFLIVTEGILRIIDYSFALYPEKIQFGWPTKETLEYMYLPDEDLFWVTKDYKKKIDSAIDNKARIVFMGCSCTEFGIYDKRFAKLVSKKTSNHKLEYANLGVGGWTSYQGLQQLKRDILRIKPHVITIYYGWNDHWVGFGVEDEDMAKIVKSSAFLNKFQGFRISRLIMRVYAEFLYKKNKAKKRKVDFTPQRVPPEYFKKNIIEIVRMAKKNNIIPVLLTAPTSHIKGKEPNLLGRERLLSIDRLVPVHEEYVNIVRNVAKAENVILCDLTKKFDKMSREVTGKKYFWEDGIHLTKEGSQKVAEYLFECFEKNNLLKDFL